MKIIIASFWKTAVGEERLKASALINNSSSGALAQVPIATHRMETIRSAQCKVLGGKFEGLIDRRERAAERENLWESQTIQREIRRQHLPGFSLGATRPMRAFWRAHEYQAHARAMHEREERAAATWAANQDGARARSRSPRQPGRSDRKLWRCSSSGRVAHALSARTSR